MTVPTAFHWSESVPWLLVILGWVLVNAQHNSREDRKEVRARVDFVKRMVDEAESAAMDHHTVSQDAIRCMKIKRVLTRLGKELAMLALAGLKIDSAKKKGIIKLRQSITLKNFDSRRYVVLSPSDPLVSAICIAADDLRYEIEAAYAQKYSRRSWARFP